MGHAAFRVVGLFVFATSVLAEPKKFTYADRPLSPADMQMSVAGGKCDTPPRFLRGDSPKYPITQAWRRLGGKAVISFTINQAGRTENFRTVKADYLFFAGHAITAVQSWRFEPARYKGKPVAVQVVMPFTFTAEANDRLKR